MNTNKNIDYYFENARSMPLIVSVEQIETMIGKPNVGIDNYKTKLIIKSKNLLIMLTTLISSIIVFFVFNTNPNEVKLNAYKLKTNKQFVIMRQATEKKIEIVIPKNKFISNTKSCKKNIIKVNTEFGKKNVRESTDIILTKYGETAEESKNISISKKFKTKKYRNKLKNVHRKKSKSIKLNVLKSKLYKDFDKTITVEKETKYIDGSTINVSNGEGVIEIKTWNKNIVKLKAVINVKANKEEKINKFLKNIKITFEYKDNILLVKSPELISNSKFGIIILGNNTISKRKVEFESGVKVKIKDYEINFILTVPENCNLLVKNKYNDITLGNISGNIEVDLYEGNLVASTIEKDFKLKLKYGKANIKSFANATLNIYESTLRSKKGKKLKLKSKYSNIYIDSLSDINFDIYEDKLTINSNVNQMNGLARYSKIRTKNITNATLELYETKFKAYKISNVKITSKYSNFVFKNVDTFKFKSYEDEFEIISLKSAKGSSKYSNFEIDTLKKKFVINSYEGSVDIKSVYKAFSTIDVISKYTNFNFIFEKKAIYNIEAKLNYTNINSDDCTYDLYIKDDNKIKLKGHSKNASKETKSKIKFDCYEGSIDLH